jgi:hypothetical protein
MRSLTKVLLTFLSFALSSGAAISKDFATIRGKVVTCEQAFAYRDGPLFYGFQMLTSPDEVEREKRRKATIAELSKHITKLKNDYSAKSAEQKKKLYASLGTFAVSGVVKESGASTIERSTDVATKQYARVAMDRSVELQKILVDTAFQNPPSAASVVGIPLGTLALAIPQLQLGAKIYEYGVFGIDTLALVGDLYLTNEDYSKQIEQLEAALKTIVGRSTDIKVAAFIKVKNDIDAKCK